MKKVIAIVTSALLCFGLVGCKGSNKENETTTAEKNETTSSKWRNDWFCIWDIKEINYKGITK